MKFRRILMLAAVAVAVQSLSAAATPGYVIFGNDQVKDLQSNSAPTARALQDFEFASPSLRTALDRLGVVSLKPVAPGWRNLKPEQMVDRWGQRVEYFDFKDTYEFETRPGKTVAEVMVDLVALPGVCHVEPTPAIQFYNDPFFSQQWNLHNTGQHVCDMQCVEDFDIDWPEAHALQQQTGTLIGILDSGIMNWPFHEEMPAETVVNLEYSRSFHPSYPSWDWNDDPFINHGSAVASIVSALTDNSLGIAGIAGPKADGTVCALKLYGAGDTALDYVANEAAGAIMAVNMSWGSCEKSLIQRNAIRNAYLYGVSLFAASGNGPQFGCHGTNPPRYPAGHEDYVMAVAHVLGDGSRLYYNTGSWIDIAAPGGSTITTASYRHSLPDEYRCDGCEDCFGGTSAAAPTATGVAGLILGKNTTLQNDDVYEVMMRTAVDIGTPGRDEEFGQGLLKAGAAVSLVAAPNQVVHASGTRFRYSAVESRSQQFRNVVGLNSQMETWEPFWAKVYEVVFTTPANVFGNTQLTHAWVRRHATDGWKNLTSYDALDNAPWGTVTSTANNVIVTKTYTYRVFTDASESVFLGWYPFDPMISGPDHPQVALTYIVRSGNQIGERPATVPELMEPLTLRVTPSGEIRFRADGAATACVGIFDVSGREVTQLATRSIQTGWNSLQWDGKNSRGTTVAPGVYFVRVATPQGKVSRTLCWSGQSAR
jgi:hypothetical protein